MLKQLLEINSSVEHVGLSGIIDGKFYHTVFLPMEMKQKGFVIFEDGTHLEIKDSKKDEGKYSYFELEGRRYIFNTQDRLWFQADLVNAANAEGIKKFLDGEITNPKELYRSIKKTIREYYDFICEEELDIVICHTIHSYLLGLFGRTFYLLFDGEKNTGKSTLQNLLAKLQYHGCFAGKSSVASTVRKVHYLRASINLDEFEKLAKDDKSIITGVFNTGAYESGTYEIVNMDAKSSSGQIQVFRTFSTKTFSVNKASFADSLVSRSVLIHTVRNSKTVKSIYGLDDKQKQCFQDLTNQIFGVCLKFGQDIVNAVQNKQKQLEEAGVFGRRADLLAIICGIRLYFTSDDELLFKYMKEKEDLEEDDEIHNDRSYYAFKCFIDIASKDDVLILECPNHDLKDYIRDGLGMDEFDQYAPTPNSVARLLKRIKLVISEKDRKRKAGRGNVIYLIPRKRLIEVVERSGFKDLVARLPEIRFTPSQLELP